MRSPRSVRRWVLLGALSLVMAGCAHDNGNGDPNSDVLSPDGLSALFPTEEHPGEEYSNCLFTSPKWHDTNDGGQVIVARADGIIEGVDPDTGATDWSVELPHPQQGVKYLLATPAIVGDKLIAAYHAIDDDYGDYRTPGDDRLAHLVAVVDLDERAVDPSFPLVELVAELEANEPGETTTFMPGQALTRSRVVHGASEADELGKVYLGQGNTRDIQPWHGWAWEIDLDAWRDEGTDAAISASLNTTPEPVENCGTPGSSGSRDRKCGGGLWAPSGHLVVDEDDGGYHVILAPGNGQLDLERRDYANTLMKVEPGLDFDPDCDDEACTDFDPDQPSQACVESCENLFIPRLMSGQELQKPADGRCEGLDTLFTCWEEKDYIGGSTPVRIELDDHDVLVYPTKDGHSYLVDADHLGTMYDRHRMVELCGDPNDDCSRTWAGMSVTKPLKTEIDGEKAVLVPTFMSDQTNPAGLVAMRVVERNGTPALERAWEFPSFESDGAVNQFRHHPTRVAIGADGDIAWIVDVDRSGETGGRLTGVRIEDGQPIFETHLQGQGRRFTLPLVQGDRIYTPSCRANNGPGQLEGFEIQWD